MTKPQRIQLSRRKGWRMPPNTVKVDRSTKWGNPFVTGTFGTRKECVDAFRVVLGGWLCVTDKPSIEEQKAYRKYIGANLWRLEGKNLACWCPPDAPCHADVLFEALRYRKEKKAA